MVLQMWFSEDVHGALVAGLLLAIESAGPGNVEYLRGVVSMAKHQSAVFGLRWSSVVDDVRGTLGDDLGGLLDAVEDARVPGVPRLIEA